MVRLLKYIGVICVVILGIIAYSQIAMRINSTTPPEMVSKELQADKIFVDKSARKLTLLKEGKELKSYRISLGGNPIGHKSQEGDARTPEGEYVIDWRNANSIAHLSLHISYPNQTDKEQAEVRGVSAGGNIMIHGILNGWGWLGLLHRSWDWTNGCIAVTNAEMQEIWSFVPNGTPIIIR